MGQPLTILVGHTSRLVRVSDEVAQLIAAGEPVQLNGVTYKAHKPRTSKSDADTPSEGGDET